MAIHYGREAELPGSDREAQEISMLALHLLQSALVLVNTRLVDRVLAAPRWARQLTDTDLRGLTPLFWSNVALHGTFELDLDKRLDYDLGAGRTAATAAIPTPVRTPGADGTTHRNSVRSALVWDAGSYQPPASPP